MKINQQADAGHFALEEEGEQIAKLIRNFLGRNLSLTQNDASTSHKQ